MSRNKTTTGYGKSPRTRIIRVAPITHAVRIALAASATVFALAGSGAALAQTCTDETNNTVYCDGAFAEPVAYENVDDLTVVLGANSPTSVTVTGESVGVLVSGTGTLGITSDADVTLSSPYNASGLAVTSIDGYFGGMGMVKVENSGDVVVEALAYAEGVSAFGGVVDVVNSGALSASTQERRAFGIYAGGLDATVSNSGSIASTSQSGVADGMYVFGRIVEVANSGTISASAATRAAGIAVWGRFTPTVINCGDITATSEDATAHGVVVRWGNDGTATAINRGSITAIATGDDIGVPANAIGIDGRSIYTGYVTLRNRGGIDVSAAGGDATGIFGETRYGEVSLVNGGAIEAFSAEGDATGMRAAQTAHPITGEANRTSISNSGSIVAATEGTDSVDPDGNPDPVSAVGILATAPGDITVTSGGDITASSLHTNAVGILAHGANTHARNSVQARNSGNIAVDGEASAFGIWVYAADRAYAYNRGMIVADAAYSIGALAFAAEGKATVTNTAHGNVSASSGNDQAFGLIGLSYYGDVEINNLGDLAAAGAYSVDASGNAYGARAVYGAFGRTAFGGMRIINRGDIAVENEYGQAVGVDAMAAGNVRVHNARTGSITALATGYGSEDISPDAIGVRANSDARARVTNYGAISAISFNGDAVGVDAAGDVAHVKNAGTINVDGFGAEDATGISALADTHAKVENDGSIVVGNIELPLTIGYGDGIQVASNGRATVHNSGTIEVGALYGTGIAAFGALGVLVSNSGSITPAGWEYGYGITAVSSQGDVTVDNSGLIDLAHNVRAGYGIQAFTDAGDVSVHNGETGTVYARARVGYGIGIMGVSVTGDVAIDNAGSVEAVNGNYAHQLYAVHGHSSSGDVTVENSGAIAASNPGTYENWTRGILATTYDGNVLVDNAGTIDVVARHAGVADGVRATSLAGDIGIGNEGAISVNVTGPASGYPGPYAFGVYAATDEGAVLATNAGAIDVGSEEGFATGVHAESVSPVVSSPPSYSDAEVVVHNTAAGTIDVAGYLGATGIEAVGDIVVVDNAGLIEAAGGAGIYTAAASSLGVIAMGQALASVDNTGRVEASGSIRTIGIYADATGPEAIARVSNAGDLIATSASSYGDVAAGIAAISADGVEVNNTGSIQTSSQRAFGIYADGDDLVIANAGTIAANGVDSQDYHYGSVTGIAAFGAGAIEITTLEDSSITAESLPYAVGIIASGGDDVRIDNAGDISVVDDFDRGSGVDFGFGNSYGIYAAGSSAEGVQIDIDNSGEITADVTIGDAMGIVARAFGGEGSSIDIANDGGIDVYSDGVRRSISTASVYGVRASTSGDATVVNDGDIDVGIGFGTVFGIRVDTAGDAAVRNGGMITVTGGSVGNYVFDNFGISVRSPDAGIQVDNAGQVAVTAAGSGDYGNNAIGIFADGGEVMVTNTGSITTYSRIGAAVGVATQGDALTVVNHGDIHATTATIDPYNAIGVQMDATTSATFNNTGSIRTTTADGTGVAVLINSGGTLHFTNTGILEGAVITHSGDDSFTGESGSAWRIANQSTDLGAGADHVHNVRDAVIELANGGIELGEGRNSFWNDGLIRVRGDSMIDMGGDAKGGPIDAKSRDRGRFGGFGRDGRPMPLINNGVIDLGGASTDDRLTIAGDLGGWGAIRLGLVAGSADGDRLTVEGSVRPGSSQTVNVTFDGFEAIKRGNRTDFAFVRGDSAPGSFVGGEVLGFEPGNFVRLGVDVSSRIDASNTIADVFSATVQARGLDDSGRLAASVGAGAQSLLASQIGTWRQRSGVLPGQVPDRKVTAFVRAFRDEGDISSIYTGNVGQGGNFGFDQRNAGAELGMRYQPIDGFSMGVLLGKSEGQQTLTGSGHGLNWVRADTLGLYGTWVSPKGLYVDTSVWWMDFDSRMDSSGSRHDTRGDARAVNVETGYAFELSSGLRLEPWLQYTWTQVDGLSLHGSQAEFRSEAGDWRRARLGLLAWKPIHGGSGITWTPYGSASVVRMDDANTGYTVSDVFNGSTSVEGTSTLLELGLGMQRRRFSASAGVNWTSGDTVGNFLGGQVLLRYGW